jgi:hypothetical protein
MENRIAFISKNKSRALAIVVTLLMLLALVPGLAFAAAAPTPGYSSTGVSLGSLGGYAEFQFSTPVTNTVTNPYGVDFIVYGNAFSENPEAGIVQVAQDLDNDGVPDEWYELAGSRYYESDTVLNETVQYSLVTSGVNVSENSGTATSFTTSTSWWPYYANLNHGATSGIAGTAVNIKGYQYVDFPNNAPNPDTTITYTGLTKVPFNNSTDYYQFGYSDVHANGARYGTAVNPYTIAAGDSGGDGYDISWAVDIPTGEPVALGSISFVRVYTGVLRNVGVVGETSTEVCGIYTAAGTGGGTPSTAPVITFDDYTIEELIEEGVNVVTTTVSDNQEIITITGLSAFLSSPTVDLDVTGFSNIYINSSATASSTITFAASGTTLARVVAQTGTQEPYIVLLKLS